MPKIKNNEQDLILQTMELLPKEGASREATGKALKVNLHPRTLHQIFTFGSFFPRSIQRSNSEPMEKSSLQFLHILQKIHPDKFEKND